MQIPYEEELCALADAVWETPEPGFREYKSSAAHVEFLKKHGFEVKTDVAKTGTGYEASWGSGHPVIAFLGEFDALYGMNQKADCPSYHPEDPDGMGQGCGHHMLGRIGVVWVEIGMILLGQPAIGPLDFFIRCIGGDSQYLIWVLHHRLSSFAACFCSAAW